MSSWLSLGLCLLLGLLMIGVGCVVLKAYKTEGSQVLLRAFNEPGYLEKLTLGVMADGRGET